MEFRALGPIELWSAGRRCDLGGPGAIHPGHAPAGAAGDGPGRDPHRPALGYGASAQGQGQPFCLRGEASGVPAAGRGGRRAAGGAGAWLPARRRSRDGRRASVPPCAGRRMPSPPAATTSRPRAAARGGHAVARRGAGRDPGDWLRGCGTPRGGAPGRHPGAGRVRAGAGPAWRPGR